MNFCDHGHATTETVKKLPTGGDGNMIVCLSHYLKEMEHRRYLQRNFSGAWEFPTWESLQIYESQ